jgi:acyl-CoA thioester hydrolase
MEREDGAFMVVVEAQCRYLAPARFDDEVLIETTACQARGRVIRFDYRMRHAATGQAIAEGSTRHMVCGPGGRRIRLPEKYRSYFEPAVSRTGI